MDYLDLVLSKHLSFRFSRIAMPMFSQQIAIYDFENLTLGNITNQDGWEYSTSLSTQNSGYNCPKNIH